VVEEEDNRWKYKDLTLRVVNKYGLQVWKERSEIGLCATRAGSDLATTTLSANQNGTNGNQGRSWKNISPSYLLHKQASPPSSCVFSCSFEITILTP
jgi:hypothetical protein